LCGSSFETPRKSAAPQDDAGAWAMQQKIKTFRGLTVRGCFG